MADNPSVRASRSPELDAVTAAQQWLVDRGLAVPSQELPSATRSRRQRVHEPRSTSGLRSESVAHGRSGPKTADPNTEHLARDQEARARAVVLAKLSAQARTRYELDKALRAKDVPAEIADLVLDRMEEVGLVDDASFAHDWVSSRQQRRQLSRRALGRELGDRGVSPDQIADALAAVGFEQEYDSALELAQRRHRLMSELPRDVVRRRLAGVLARRGFGSGVISRVLAEVEAPDRERAGRS